MKDDKHDHQQEKVKQTALVLQGGGALGAYEVGALTTIVKLAVQENGNADSDLFNVVSGSSIGAINGAILVQEFVKNRSWTEAVKNLEIFWRKQMSTDSYVDNIPDFSKWWQYWSKFTGDATPIATNKAARRYYSSLQFWLFGIPGIFHLTLNLIQNF